MCSNTTSSSRFGVSAGQHHDHDDRVLTIRGSPVGDHQRALLQRGST